MNNHVSDIPYNQTSQVEEYIEAFDINRRTIDWDVVNAYANSDYTIRQKILNSINNNINTMQNYWNEDVIEELNSNADEFQNWIDNFQDDTKPWNSGSSNKYYKNDVVTYNNDGAYYLCLKDCDGTQLLPTPSNPTNEYWTRLYVQGNPGLNAYNLIFTGEWWDDIYYTNYLVYILDKNVDFYVCLNDDVETNPKEDTVNWTKLFSLPRDSFQIFPVMPNQTYFNDPTSSTVFGVINKDDAIIINSGDYTKSISPVSPNGERWSINGEIPHGETDYIIEDFSYYGLVSALTYNNNIIKYIYGSASTLGIAYYPYIDENLQLHIRYSFDGESGSDTLYYGIYANWDDKTLNTGYDLIPQFFIPAPAGIKIVDRLNSESAINPKYISIQTDADIVYDKNTTLYQSINNLLSNHNL